MKSFLSFALLFLLASAASAASCYNESDVNYTNGDILFMNYREVLVVTRNFHLPPEELWDYIANPEKINRWGTPRVRMLTGSHDVQGSIREAVVPLPLGLRMTLHEKLCVMTKPSYYQYEIVKGLGFRKHLGQISIGQGELGSVLEWRINFTPDPAHVPFIRNITGHGMKAFLESQLVQSLDNLDKLIRAQR